MSLISIVLIFLACLVFVGVVVLLATTIGGKNGKQ